MLFVLLIFQAYSIAEHALIRKNVNISRKCNSPALHLPIVNVISLSQERTDIESRPFAFEHNSVQLANNQIFHNPRVLNCGHDFSWIL